MEQRPEQPPEGRLIADAADHMNLSIREAARRAGISYGRWRQIATGYQNISSGVFAPVHAPAKTLARMAAVVGVTADQMETEGLRPDAAEIMRRDVRPAPPAPREHDFGGDGESDWEALQPFIQEILRAAYERLGFLGYLPPGPLPDPSEIPESLAAEARVSAIPGHELFPGDPRDAGAWDDPGLSLRQKLDLIAWAHRLVAEADQRERRTGTGLGRYPALAPVAGTAYRASS